MHPKAPSVTSRFPALSNPTLRLIAVALLLLGALNASVYPYQSLIGIEKIGLSKPVFSLVLVLASLAGAGLFMLRKGGSATDAAIATMLALTVVEPQSSGIGGGGFYVTADAKGRVETIDGRETAPAAAHPQWFYKDGKVLSFREAVPGGTSVGVPGRSAPQAVMSTPVSTTSA